MIYAIAAADADEVKTIKFGRSKDPAKRLLDLQPGSPLPLRLYGKAEWPDSFELLIHRRFADKRQHGEWFTVDDDINEFMMLMVFEPDKARHIIETGAPLPTTPTNEI